MGSPMGIVVWEWLNIGGSWHAFLPSLSDSIDIQFIAWNNGMGGGTSLIQLGNFDSSYKDSVLDFQKNIQVNPSGSQRSKLYGRTQAIRRSIYPMNSPPAIGIEWQWSSDIPGQWVPYNVSIQVLLEDASNQGVQQIDLARAPDPLSYVIDFVSRCQINHVTRYTRQIQRVQTAWKYTQTAPLPPTFTTGLAQVVINNQLTATPTPFNGFCSGAYTFGLAPSSLNQMAGMNQMSLSLPYPLFSASSQYLGGPPGFPGPPSSFSGFNNVQMNLNPGNVHTNFAASFMANSFPHSGNVGAGSSKPYSLRSSSRQQQQQQHQPNLVSGVSLPVFFPGSIPPGASSKTTFSSTKPGARSKNGGSGAGRKRTKTEPITISNKDCPIGGVSSLNSYVIPVDQPLAEEDCCICCDKLTESSGYDAGSSGSNVVQLVKCKHTFHRACIAAMVENGTKDGSLQCPTCKHIYGVKCGLCPDGFMQYNTDQSSLQGYPNCGTIRIIYMIQPGKQGPGHPNPGKSYNARGFPRQGFLPDNEEGKKVLQLLIIAWKRRLTFTVGTSVTTGEPDTVVWNEIHHKTDTQNTHGHGYPDANYLTNVTAELANQGVVYEQGEEDE